MAFITSVRGKEPRWGNDCFLAENATVVGDVTMGDRCTVWFNAVIRGDVHSIEIGNDTNIQDGAVIHCTYKKANTIIGSRVSIGHNAIVHGCTLEDDVLVGMGAIIMDNALIGKYSVIAAGAVILQGTKVEEGSLYAGVPARRIKDVDSELRNMIDRTAVNYPKYAKWFE